MLHPHERHSAPELTPPSSVQSCRVLKVLDTMASLQLIASWLYTVTVLTSWRWHGKCLQWLPPVAMELTPSCCI